MMTEIEEEAALKCLSKAMFPRSWMLREELRVYPREDDPDYKKDSYFVYDNIGYY
jgi:hypothetical protein